MNRFAGSKLYHLLNLGFDLVVLNLLTIIGFLGIVTIVPSIIACFYVCKLQINNKSTKIFKSYFEGFRLYFRKGLYLNLILFAVVAVLGFSALQFYDLMHIDSERIIYLIGFVITLIMMATFIFLTFQFYLIIIYINNLRFLDTVKLSIFFTGRFVRTQMQILVWFLLSGIVIFFLGFHALIYLGLIGIALVIYLIVYGTKHLYNQLAEKFNISEENMKAL
ncbi:MAG: DUF624 domain-containing protein [Erysipelotrichales bacterium]|nr:DUF624 domain-containing protein [Erysipelotrichales bacterium]